MPATGHAGRPLAITHTVRNAGTAPAGAFAIRFFLSTHDTFDASDVLPGTRAWRAWRRRQQPGRQRVHRAAHWVSGPS